MRKMKLDIIFVGSLALAAPAFSLAEQQPFPQAIRGSRELSGSSFLCRWFPRLCPQPDCPVVAPVTSFELEKYTEKSWYIHKQQVNPYQDEDSLFCVTATYNDDRDDGLISVNNYANKGEVNGPSMGSSDSAIGNFFGDLCSRQIQENQGELQVAPCFLNIIPGLFRQSAGPYWVLAVGDDYEWAIVSGGQPDVVRQENPLQCSNKEGNGFWDINGSGLWLFTRSPERDDNVISTMESKLQEMGVYTDLLKDVEHQDCLYEGANLK